MHETTGVLRPAVEAYLTGATLTPGQIAALRAYLRQWIMAPAWCGADVTLLRGTVEFLSSRSAISSWLARAELLGIDPL